MLKSIHTKRYRCFLELPKAERMRLGIRKPLVAAIVSSELPPSEWRDVIERAYWTIPEIDAPTWTTEANSRIASKDTAGLLAHATEWTRAEPKNASTWYLLGVAHNGLAEQLGDAAILFFQQALESRNAKERERLLREGEAQSSLSSSEIVHAKDANKEAIRLKPDLAQAWYNLGIVCLVQNNQDGALAAYTMLQSLDTELAKRLLDVITQWV